MSWNWLEKANLRALIAILHALCYVHRTRTDSGLPCLPGESPREMYIDKQSGRDFNRPACKRLLKKLRPGDLLVVGSIDRLGRNYDEILEQWRVITKVRQTDILVLDMPLLDTRQCGDILGSFIAGLVLQILSYVAHTERENIHRRQAEGIAAAKARGVRFGRPAKEFSPDFDALYASWRSGEISGELAARCDMALGVVYRKLRQRGIYLQAERKKGKP